LWKITASAFQCATYRSRRRFPIKLSNLIKLFFMSHRPAKNPTDCWSIGVLEWWSAGEMVKFGHPSLHHSITPALRSGGSSPMKLNEAG
jgi:hypothetical protein